MNEIEWRCDSCELLVLCLYEEVPFCSHKHTPMSELVNIYSVKVVRQVVDHLFKGCSSKEE